MELSHLSPMPMCFDVEHLSMYPKENVMESLSHVQRKEYVLDMIGAMIAG